ncbi:uncharacterized protein LOC113226338 [Hyposmocoma kahamanoa]|uniref:uncharacterized protein LOC113226338 n=1 Tax=Hyposmocoma kahamanoa TaxID=1477025 RepID=UPI000E6D8592|nr:uncharacterized protein LOC113226338 [Hyposmocoma kahamanoa]
MKLEHQSNGRNPIVTIIYKKGDIAKLSNYRPISLLCQIYKLFTKILTIWLTSELDEAQPIEQAGFRSGFSTIDHINTVNQVMGKCLEFNRPLVMAFVDYEKAFDSIKHWAVFHALHRCHINSRYSHSTGNERLKRVYQNVCLGHLLSFGKEHQPKEISKRIQLGWAAFSKLGDILKSGTVPLCLKTRLFNQSVLPTMTYGDDTWTFTQETVYRLIVAQRAMERAMLGISLVDRVLNVKIRRWTKVQDAGARIMELKRGWAGQLARQGDDRWSKTSTDGAKDASGALLLCMVDMVYASQSEAGTDY